MSIFQFAGRYGPEIFEDEARRLLKSQPVSVMEKNTNNLVELYTDRTKATLAPNPFITDSRGNGYFFADPGEYDLVWAGWRLPITVDMDPVEAQGDGPPTGPAGGDLEGFYPNPTVNPAAPGLVAAIETHRTDTTDVHGIANTALLATQAYVQAQIDALVTGAPGTLDTLNELAAALGDDPNFAATVTTQLAGKVDASILTPSTVLGRLSTGGVVAITPAQLSAMLGLSGGSYSVQLGAGTGVTNINHGLDTTSIKNVNIRKVSTGEWWHGAITIVDANNLTIDFGDYVRVADEFVVEVYS